MQPVLVVGGTGMLAGVVRELVRVGHPVAVVARRRQSILGVGESCAAPGLVDPVVADYAEPDDLRVKLRRLSEERGQFGLAVRWVHPPHRDSVHSVLAEVLPAHAAVLDVLGSGAADPARSAESEEPPEVLRSLSLRYGRVVLGFADGPAGTRWLTHDEISAGVLTAVRDFRETSVVGRVRPWSDRP